MPQFTLVYFELTRITKTIQAADLEKAMLIGADTHADGFWDDCDEDTFGTEGIEAVYNKRGKLLYDAGIHDPETGLIQWGDQV